MNEPKPIEAETRGGSCAPAPCSALRVEAAAILTKTGEIVTMPPPARHSNLRAKATGKEGFLLSDGTWCDRARAADVAKASGQLTGPLSAPWMGGLCTDDVW